MTVYKYQVWKDEEVGVREVLVVASSEEEANAKIENSNVEFDDYALEDDDDFETVIF